MKVLSSNRIVFCDWRVIHSLKSAFLCGLIFFGYTHLGTAQSPRALIKQGNALYKEGKFAEALEIYQRVAKQNPEIMEALFNTANAKYRTGDFEASKDAYQRVAEKATSDNLRTKAMHNLGNSYLSQKEYQKSINAYKEALKINPNDEDARYNLAYAKKMMQIQQQQQQNNQNNDKQDNKDNQQDQQNQNQHNDKKDDDKKDDDKKNDDKKDNKQNQPNNDQKQEMSKEEAKQMLEALNRREKELQEKMKKDDKRASNRVIEKDW